MRWSLSVRVREPLAVLLLTAALPAAALLMGRMWLYGMPRPFWRMPYLALAGAVLVCCGALALISPRRWPATFTQFAALMLGGAAAAALFADRHWLAEMATPFRLFYLGGFLALGAALALLRRPWPSAGCLAAALLHVPFAAEYLRQAPLPVERGAPVLRVAAVNLLCDNRRIDLLLAFLDREAPDVVAFSEVSAFWVAELAKLKDRYPHQRIDPGMNEEGFTGIALLSRRPLTDVTVRHTPEMPWQPWITARLADPPMTVVAAHPPPPMRPRFVEERNRQYADIAAWLASQPGDKVLLGDLNGTPWSPSLRRLMAEAELRDARLGFGVQPTWPAENPVARIPIDFCLVSDRVAVADHRRGRWIGSDHLPIVADLVLPEFAAPPPPSPASEGLPRGAAPAAN